MAALITGCWRRFVRRRKDQLENAHFSLLTREIRCRILNKDKRGFECGGDAC